MRKVFLHGKLAGEFGHEFYFDVFSAAEAVRALEANFPGRFYRSFGPGQYRVVKGEPQGGQDLDESLLSFGLGEHNLHFIPVAAGSKSGGMMILTGALIITAAVFTAGAAAGAAFGTMEMVAAGGMGATTFAGISMAGYAAFGAAMVLNGISSILSPTMKLSGSGTRVAQDARSSYVFQGPVNTYYQGGPVPVIYGTRVRVGSTVISSSLTLENVAS